MPGLPEAVGWTPILSVRRHPDLMLIREHLPSNTLSTTSLPARLTADVPF